VRNLASLQRAFQRHVYQPGPAMERAVLAGSRASAERRLGIYADAYRLRLVEALGTDYPALRGLLGEGGFDRVMREFISVQPSRHRNLRWYGGELARFLERSARWRRRPLLAELARFEWALGLAFDAADVSLVSAEAVARVPVADWPGMRLRLVPSVRLLALRGNAPQVWRAALAGRKPPAAAMRRRPVNWLVWRKGHEPFYRALPPDEAWALNTVMLRRSFGALCDGLRHYVDQAQAARRAAQLFKGWLDEGLVSAIH
jgi:hypothetical protein